ncbi:MAG: MarC family protein [Candidatus Saganbacteria bacterium]|nr:MarC family protein [Candidatus Saganbacteria bacterium]
MPWAIDFLKAFVALFIIIDPIGNIPFFMSMTGEMPEVERRKIFRVAELTAFLLLLIFVSFGSLILEIFRITLNDFKIAGGLLLFVISVEMLLQGKVHVEHKEDVGAVPLGCPLLVGPGAITTGMVLMGSYGFLITMSAVLLNFVIIWLILRHVDRIYSFLGKTGSVIITRVISILIAAIAIQFIREGIQHIFNI